MKTAVLTLAFLFVLACVPAMAQPPQLSPEAQRAPGSAGAADAASACSRLAPPVEDFKPSLLNSQANSIPRSTRNGASGARYAPRRHRPCNSISEA